MLQSMGVPKSQTSLSNRTELMTMIKKVTYCVGEIRRQKGNTSVDLSDTLEIRNKVFLLNKRQPFRSLFPLVDDLLLNLTCSVPHGSPKKKSPDPIDFTEALCQTYIATPKFPVLKTNVFQIYLNDYSIVFVCPLFTTKYITDMSFTVLI